MLRRVKARGEISSIAPYAGNYKLADVPAALIGQRLMTRDYWSPRYRLQYKRLRQLAEHA